MIQQTEKRKSKEEFPDSLSLPLFTKDWSVFQELLLLEALEMFGFEDWTNTAAFIGDNCTPAEARNHYYKYYGNHKSEALLPKEDEWIILENVNPVYLAKTKDNVQRREQAIQNNKGYEQAMKSLPIHLPNAFGLYEKIKDFNINYNPTLEFLIRNVKFNPEDTETERQQKIQLTKTYIKKVEDRRYVEKKAIQKGLFQTKIEVSKLQKKEEARKKKKKSKKVLRKKVQLEEDSDQLKKRTWDSYLKLSEYDADGQLQSLMEKYMKKNQELKVVKDLIEKQLQIQ